MMIHLPNGFWRIALIAIMCVWSLMQFSACDLNPPTPPPEVENSFDNIDTPSDLPKDTPVPDYVTTATNAADRAEAYADEADN